MSRRFTDTEKWRKPFIRQMDSAYKLLWFYILDDCDHAGLWIPDFEVAQLRIGERIRIEKATELFKDYIRIINDELWFIPSFVEDQYGILSPGSRIHASVIKRLNIYGLWNSELKGINSLCKGFTKSMQRVKDKDMNKDKNKDKDKDKDMVFDNVTLKKNEYNKLIDRFGEKETKVYIDKLSSYMYSKGKKYKSHYHTILNWEQMRIDRTNGNKTFGKKIKKITDKDYEEKL